MRSGKRGSLVVAIAAVVAAAALLDAGAGSASAPRAWQTIPIPGPVQNVIPIGWASGRAWFVVETTRAQTDALDVWSARVAAGKLTSLVSTPNVGWNGDGFLVGSTLCCLFPNGAPMTSAPLLASGKVGDWTSIPGDPGQVVQTALLPAGALPDGHWGPVGGATAAGKPAWLVRGHSCPLQGSRQCTIDGGGFDTLAMCCTAAGAPTDLGPLFAGEKTSAALRLGTDARGRLWLSWASDPRKTVYPELIDLQQIDPVTLAPTGPKMQLEAYPVDALGTGALALVCSDACRVVYQTLSGVFVWSGTGAPRRLWSIDRRKDKGGSLLAEGAGGGGLVLVSESNKVPNVPDDGQILTVSHASASGRSVHATASIPLIHAIPVGNTHYLFPGPAAAMVTPAGVVYLGYFTADFPGGRGRLLATVLR